MKTINVKSSHAANKLLLTVEEKNTNTYNKIMHLLKLLI